jgi:putative acetyltransferase
VLDVDGELPELRRIASHFAEAGGQFWVAEQGGRVIGCAGFTPASEPGGVELRKLYVNAAVRKSGLGTAFCERVEAEGRRRGASFVDLWSDTRFTKAHRLYDKRGYVRGPATRSTTCRARSSTTSGSRSSGGLRVPSTPCHSTTISS